MAATGEPYSVAARALAAAEPAASPNPPPPIRCRRAVAASRRRRARGQRRSAPPTGALAEVIACAGRTLTAPSARLQIRADTDLGRDPDARSRAAVAGPIGRLAGRAARAAWERIAPDTDPAELREQFLHQFGEGFIEPAAGRYLSISAASRRCSSTAGGSAACPGSRSAPATRTGPIGSGATTRWTGSASCRARRPPAGPAHERVRWTACRVAAATAGADEFTVWIDGQRIRRFQTVERGSGRSARATKTETVELWDFGVPVDSLDWSRLPSFRTPARPLPRPGSTHGRRLARRTRSRPPPAA